MFVQILSQDVKHFKTTFYKCVGSFLSCQVTIWICKGLAYPNTKSWAQELLCATV